MGAPEGLDFASLLDDLIAASDEAAARESGDPRGPSLQVDMLAQIERLQAQSNGLFAESAMREYDDQQRAASDAGTADPGEAARDAGPSTPDLQPALDDLFFLDPESIARELGITAKSKPEELDRARRSFAMRFLPDRVPEEARERAALRMQIANMLIDTAKRARR